jgi:hypothetical protein
MQIVNGFVCMDCTDVDHAKKFVDPAHPNRAATASSEPRKAAEEASSPTDNLTQDAVSFGGSLSRLNALDVKKSTDPKPRLAGSRLDILV